MKYKHGQDFPRIRFWVVILSIGLGVAAGQIVAALIKRGLLF